MSTEFVYALLPEDPLFVPTPAALEKLVIALREGGWLPREEHFDVEVPDLGHCAFSHETYDFRAGDFCKKSSAGQGVPLDADYWRDAMSTPSELWVHQTWLVDTENMDVYPWACLENHRPLLTVSWRDAGPYDDWVSFSMHIAVSDRLLFTTLGLDCRCGQSLTEDDSSELASPTCEQCGASYNAPNRPSPGWDAGATNPAFRFGLKLRIHAYGGIREGSTKSGSSALFSDDFAAAVESQVGTNLLSFVDYD